MSYKYSPDSKQTEAQFNQIANKISEKLMKGNDKQFDQVCFYLDINTKITNKKDGKKSLQAVDFAFNLVNTIITECMDKIDYTKI